MVHIYTASVDLLQENVVLSMMLSVLEAHIHSLCCDFGDALALLSRRVSLPQAYREKVLFLAFLSFWKALGPSHYDILLSTLVRGHFKFRFSQMCPFFLDSCWI